MPPDDLIRESLRDLIPTYQGPPDPFVRVGATIRRRRARRRSVAVLGSVACVLAVVAAVPVATGLFGGGAAPALLPPGARPLGVTGDPGAPLPLPPAHAIAKGAVPAGTWKVGAGQVTETARRCLRGHDAVFDNAAVCFDDWTPGGVVTWAVVGSLRPGAAVTAVVGVAAEPVGEVLVVFSDGAERRAVAVAAPGQPKSRFFALVVDKPGLAVTSVTTLTDDGTLRDLAVVTPGSTACVPAAVKRVVATPAC